MKVAIEQNNRFVAFRLLQNNYILLLGITLCFFNTRYVA